MSTRSSGAMTIQGLTSTPPSLGGSHGLALTRTSSTTDSASLRYSHSPIPPPTAAVATRNVLRSIAVVMAASPPPRRLGFGHEASGLVHGVANLGVGAAAADVGHLAIDVGVGRFGIARQERGRGHDLARLAVAALRHLLFNPSGDDGVVLVLGDVLD